MLALWLCLLVLPRAARAETEAEAAAPATEFGAPPVSSWALRLDITPGWAVGVDGSAGVALLATTERSEAHGIVEGRVRARLGFVQLGALIEQSDDTEQEWRSLGGFAGAFLPYRNWVDWEVSVGAVVRRFRNTDPRFGAGGYDVSNVAILLRAGFSDRSSEGLFGIRLGAHLTLTSDLAPRDVAWRYNLGSASLPSYVYGRARVGGHSVSLAVGGGFDLATPRARLRPSP